MGGLQHVVLGFGARRVARQSARAAQRGEILAPREQLMHVGLMPRVEDDRVLGGAEHAMQANRQLDDTEVRAEVAARARHVVDQEGADLRRQLIQLFPLEATQLPRGGTARQQVTRA